MKLEQMLSDLGEMANAKAYMEVPQDPAVLTERFTELMKHHKFVTGQLVTWKPGLKNRKPVGPFIVTGFMEEPVFEDRDEGAGCPDYMALLDIRIGMICKDGDFAEYLVDSRRLMPLNE